MQKESETILREGLIELNLRANDEIIDKINRFIRLFIDWNKKSNLSAIRDEKSIIIKHFLDSLSIVPAMIELEIWNPTLPSVDLGTGAGFPGVPLRVVEPDMAIDFAEVNKKKVCFLQELILNLPIPGAKILDSSAGKVNPKYELLFTRAFGSLTKIVQESRKYMSSGTIIAYKGKKDTVLCEIAELSSRRVKNVAYQMVKTPSLQEERHLVIITI